MESNTVLVVKNKRIIHPDLTLIEIWQLFFLQPPLGPNVEHFFCCSDKVPWNKIEGLRKCKCFLCLRHPLPISHTVRPGPEDRAQAYPYHHCRVRPAFLVSPAVPVEFFLP